jgi:murein DD-endopeptidase MepM/ murein hydrolase activator NlpD
MTWPVPGNIKISTPYGKRGSHWSCNKNSSGQGIHTGVDFACASGTPVYATIAGEVRHRNYGSAFGRHQVAISPDPGQPFADGEVFYAHMRSRVADGTRVKPGDKIGEVGAEGNVTGPHLHYEFHPTTKNRWNCSVVADPAPTLSDAVSGPYVTKDIYSSKLGYGEPTNGDADSDTVKELQERLNRISLQGGQTLTVNGKYDDDTDDEVRKWQEQIVHDTPDAPGKSYLGPRQMAAMFPSPPYVLHDNGLPAIAGGTTPPEPPPEPEVPTVGSTVLGEALLAAGFTVHDADVPLGRESTWRGVEFLMVHHTGSPDTNTAASDARWIRTGNADAPLAQLMLDQTGEVWVCCAPRGDQPDPGRASHAGRGNGYGVPDDKMNEVSLGIECKADGSRPLADYPVMYEALIRLLRFLSERYGVPTDNIIGHKEWSSTGKVDPRDDMDTVRADVAGDVVGPPPVAPDGMVPVRVVADGLMLETYWPVAGS